EPQLCRRGGNRGLCRSRRSHAAQRQRHRSRRRRPAVQQPAALPDAQLLHPAAGRVSAADLDRSRGGRSERIGPRRPPLDTLITLRPIRPEDRGFLFRVYASTREEELALTDWDEEQKRAFLEGQFAAQDTWYRERYEG